MEQQLLEGVQKGRRWALEILCQENLKRSWFLCYQLAGDTAGAAPLLISSWKAALKSVSALKTPVEEDFETLLSGEILSQYQKGLEHLEEFESLPPPQVAKVYQPLVDEVGKLPPKARPYYWLYAYGGMTPQQISQAAGEPEQPLEERLAQWEEFLAQKRVRWTLPQRAAYVRLTTQFRDMAGNGFQEVEIPETLGMTLWKQVGLPVKPPKKRKKRPWTGKRLAFLGMGVGVGAVLLAVGVLVLVLCL